MIQTYFKTSIPHFKSIRFFNHIIGLKDNYKRKEINLAIGFNYYGLKTSFSIQTEDKY